MYATIWRPLVILLVVPGCYSATSDAELKTLKDELISEFGRPVDAFHVHREGSELRVEFDNYDVDSTSSPCSRIDRVLQAEASHSHLIRRIEVQGARSLPTDGEPPFSYPICTLERSDESA